MCGDHDYEHNAGHRHALLASSAREAEAALALLPSETKELFVTANTVLEKSSLVDEDPSPFIRALQRASESPTPYNRVVVNGPMFPLEALITVFALQEKGRMRADQILLSASKPQNGIGDAAAVLLAERLKESMCFLTHLALGCQGVTRHGATLLAQGLQKNRTLIMLDLSDNAGVGHAGVMALLGAIEVRQTVTRGMAFVLSLQRCELSEESVEAILRVWEKHPVLWFQMSDNQGSNKYKERIDACLLKMWALLDAEGKQ
jgi:hypothetical protein